MATSYAWEDLTLAQLQGLRSTILKSSGQSQVRYADRTVTWSSEAERMRTVAAITAEINRRDGRAPLRRLRIGSQKGFES